MCYSVGLWRERGSGGLNCGSRVSAVPGAGALAQGGRDTGIQLCSLHPVRGRLRAVRSHRAPLHSGGGKKSLRSPRCLELLSWGPPGQGGWPGTDWSQVLGLRDGVGHTGWMDPQQGARGTSSGSGPRGGDSQLQRLAWLGLSWLGQLA